MKKNRFLIVGAGFTGAVIAERLSKKQDCEIVIIDERNHIGGNCHTKRDDETGVMVHTYGPHIFNTDNRKVWEYINQFCEMVPFVNRVKTVYNGKVYSMPINLHTINQFFSKTFNPKEAQNFIETLGDKTITEPCNFEEQALKFIGKELYEAFFYGYTKKQWGCEPSELPASILKRLPVRFNYNDNYYNTQLQGIPRNGYTDIFEKMLDNPCIDVRLNTHFSYEGDTLDYDHIFYTGPIDAFFGYKYGRLSYRTVYFESNIVSGDYQGNPVINYADATVPYTRVHEHKHFTPWENHDKTIYFKEFSKETSEADIPYYPKRLSKDLEMLELYQNEVKKLTNFSFLGRLATYRYMDMHHVIGEALELMETDNYLRNETT
ncbi:UDP-galactopyranose mutase [Dyadobacter chenwenxiniae]|uniref:UDP-galactopyranose mutase n=1 Tax=Dyadobacter chenwenxiniae TaxID=2906456 RepID=A0A9X1PKF3_9BACT|nr:UDP-galactopyranose mutase [Dyadobacter chenwenxiniae]MCF0062715.1 UDP-galactopyranose mutase [Dyadobacter chenwenxiniae]UON83540.1 UDP-galactopyranose mutase [Dyadobacter chenwenxiniae]